MVSVDDIIKEVCLQHMYDPAEYDPVAAREYYLRTRKLKGRRLGTGKTSSPRHLKTFHKPVKILPGKKTTSVAELAAKRKSAIAERKAMEARVKVLTDKLEQLHKILAALVKEAKLRSGVAAPAKQTPAQKAQADRKLTPKEKADAAKRAKEYYDKHKDQPLSEKEQELQDKIAAATKKIQKMREEIAAAKKRTSSSVGARANR